MRTMSAMPSQKALKLPAVRPARMLSDAPPSRDAVTTSRTCADSVDVKTLTSSGMMAPASVPHVMMHGELPPLAVVAAERRDERRRDDEREDDRDDRRDPHERA